MNTLETLAPFRDHSALLLVLAPAVQSPAYEEQMNQFAGQEEKCAAHDLVLGHILYEGESRIGRMVLDPRQAAALRSHFGVGDDQFMAVFIGKEGVIRKRYEAPVASDTVFEALGVPGAGDNASASNA